MWGKDEVNFLSENFNNISFKELCEKLGKSEKSVRHKLSRLGLTKRIWNDDLVTKMVSLYEKFGPKRTSEILGVDLDKINSKINRLGLHYKYSYKTDENDVNEYNSKEGAYLLGFIWADGFVSKSRNRIDVTILDSDGENIKDLFNKFNWKIYKFNREKYKTKNVINFSICSYNLKNSLIDLGFGDKSFGSHDKVLHFLSDEFKPFFIRGLIDGDGCFYYNKKHFTRQFTITSSFNQNWCSLVKLFNTLGIKTNIKQSKRMNNKTFKENSYSQLQILGKEILKLGEYVYGDEVEISLKRKLEKFIKIKESYEYSKGYRKSV